MSIVEAVPSSRVLPVSWVKVGKRYRKDLGDLSSLADSIRTVGLIHAVVVDKNHNLICGQRRFEAWKLARPDQGVPCVIVESLDDAVKRLTAERDENTCRKEMTASELYALGKAVEKLERPKAEAREKAGKPTPGINDPQGHPTRKKVADGIGVGEATWARLKTLGDAAENGDEDAAAAIERIDAGQTTINGETTRRREERDEQLPASVGSARTVLKKRSASFVLQRASDQLAGVGEVLDGLILEGVKPDEASQLAENFAGFRSVLSRTINQLRSIQ